MLKSICINRRNPEEVYNILRPLGKGGSGSVYLAKHLIEGTMVALKRILPKSPTEKDLIVNEIALTLNSCHINILDYFETFETVDSL